MDREKIKHLGLQHLIRFDLLVKYLSFLGGEAQRSFLDSYSRVASLTYHSYPIPLNSSNKYLEFWREE